MDTNPDALRYIIRHLLERWPFSEVYSVQCTVYSVQCTVYSVRCALNIVQSIMYIVQCKKYTVQCAVYIVYCTLYIVNCTVYSVQCTVYSVQCTVYSVQCTVYSVQCTVHSVQFTVYMVQCTVYNVQCTVYSVQGRLYLVEWWAFSTLATLTVALDTLQTRKYTFCIFNNGRSLSGIYVNNCKNLLSVYPDFLKANIFTQPIFLFEIFAQTKLAKIWQENLKKWSWKGKTVVNCAFLRLKPKYCAISE